MFESIRAQIRVVAALTIREMQSQNAKMRFGFAWSVVEVLMYVGVISILRIFINAFMPPNMPPLTFLILGILPWLLFMHTYKGVETVITKNKKLLIMPVVTPLDLVFAKAIQILCVDGGVFLGLVVFSAIIENAGFPRFPLGIILSALAAWMIGLSFGMVLVPLHRMFPPSRWLLTPIPRIGILTSGLYFVIATLPSSSWKYFTWNPMLHVIELMRTYWFVTYTSPIASPAFIVECIAGLMLFGLSLERFIRRVPA